MIRAGKPATYGLENSRDVLKKLEWEQRELKATSAQEPKELFYRAFNAAVTAWHLAEWVWRDMTRDQRQQLETDWDKRLNVNDDNGGAFRKELIRINREIAICREIATASKHVDVSRNRDTTIDTVAKVRASRVVSSDDEPVMVGEHFVVVREWTLEVLDGPARRDFIEIIDLVIEFWTDFVDQRGIGK